VRAETGREGWGSHSIIRNRDFSLR